MIPRTLSLIVALLLCLPAMAQEEPPKPFVLVVHGGAGSYQRLKAEPEQRQPYEAKLKEALEAGRKILEQGGSSLDAVTAAVALLEDSPLFNAGRGAVKTRDGRYQLDASIMRGDTLEAGAVAVVERVRNPIRAARLVMEHSNHVIMSGAGAEALAQKHGLSLVEQEYFRKTSQPRVPPHKHGTVGAVALDRHGHLAAATSTGGLPRKANGRIGDSPIIGAGTWADDRTCAISATGYGEYFIRLAVAKDIAAAMEYGGASLSRAAHHTIREKLPTIGGRGGVIAVDAHGNIATPYNTPGMLRGWVREDGRMEVRLFDD